MKRESNFNKADYEVRSIPYSEAKEWILYKHYAHRIPSICYAFGLYRRGGVKALIYKEFAHLESLLRKTLSSARLGLSTRICFLNSTALS